MKEIVLRCNANAVVVFVGNVGKYMRIEPRGRYVRKKNDIPTYDALINW